MDERANSQIGSNDAFSVDIGTSQNHGTIRLGERKQIVQEIEKQLEMGTTSLDTECACLLEIPHEGLYNWSSEQQQYWILIKIRLLVVELRHQCQAN